MNYPGPTAADYRNVRSLNAAFLAILRASADGAQLRHSLCERTGEQVAAITDLQRQRLAACPFLLMSFREGDRRFWERLVADDPTGDLLQAPPPAALERLTTAGLAFLWQLARRNPFAVRLVAGASTEFCERLGGLTLVRLLNRAALHGNLVAPRFSGETATWSKLLESGISPTPRVRVAAHLSVLQAMLTAGKAAGKRHLRAAACASSPALRITQKLDGR